MKLKSTKAKQEFLKLQKGTTKGISAKKFDTLFNEDKQDLTQFLDVNKAIRPNHKMKKVNIDFPLWVVEDLDKTADHLGITRQTLIKVWIAERLEKESK